MRLLEACCEDFLVYSDCRDGFGMPTMSSAINDIVASVNFFAVFIDVYVTNKVYYYCANPTISLSSQSSCQH